MIIELIKAQADEEGAESFRPYRPSPYKVSRCVRANVLHGLGFRAMPIPGRAILIFGDGDLHEYAIKERIKKTAYKLIEFKGRKNMFDIAMINGYMMTGETDGMLEDPMGGLFNLEVKSCSRYFFDKLEDDTAYEPHRRQSNLYLHGIQKVWPECTKTVLIYKNKDTAEMKEYVLEYDEALAKETIEWFELIGSAIQEKRLPKRPYSLGSWQCDYCGWQKECWKNYDLEIKSLSKDIALSEEIEGAARYYQELGAQERHCHKERAEIKEIIKEALDEAGAQSGKAGEYFIELKVSNRKQVIKELIPPEAYTAEMVERLNVRKIEGRGQT